MAQIIKALEIRLPHVSLAQHFRLSSKPDMSFPKKGCLNSFYLKFQVLMDTVQELLLYLGKIGQGSQYKYNEGLGGNNEVRTTFGRGCGCGFDGGGTEYGFG